MNLHLTEIDSTSSFIKRNIATMEHGDTVSALYQSGGRGQKGNSWESARGQNLTFSILLRPRAIAPIDGFDINHIVSLAIWNALRELAPEVELKIKWPNDIYAGDRKLAGILVESSMNSTTFETAVVGIGLNVNQTVFLSDAPNPVSLKQLTGREWDPRRVEELVVRDLLALYEAYEKKGLRYKDEYMSRLYRRGEWHRYRDAAGEEFEGKIVDVEPGGLLVVDDNKRGRRRFEFKSVKYII